MLADSPLPSTSTCIAKGDENISVVLRLPVCLCTVINKFFKNSKVALRLFNLNRLSQLPGCTHKVRQLCQPSGDIETDESRRLVEVEGIIKSCANYVPLTPISFLERAANVFGSRTSVVFDSSVKYTWEETHFRCLKLASALVATLAPNVPAMQELYFAVPMAEAVLCTLNIRLDSSMIDDLLKHSEAKVIFVDQQLLQVAQGALSLLSKDKTIKPPILVLIPESENSVPPIRETYNIHEYENLLASGSSNFTIRWPKTEFDPISTNYTSGTTSPAKGVVYNHRGAYLNTIAIFLTQGMGPMPTYLWTLPMFHCNGWCMNWGMAALGGTNICLRHVTAKHIFESISLYKVTHMSATPIVLNMMVNCPSNDRKPLSQKVEIMTGGSPPPPQIISKMEELGFGGNTVMSGYLKDVKATDEAFKGGWFHCGDLAVKHLDGYIEIKDRLNDIIISGGENISTPEVERVLYSHPTVLEAAVVARPDDHWGQVPCAFVKLKEGFEEITSHEIIKFFSDHLPHYMVPRTILFEDLPKTSIGRVQKIMLREKENALGSLSYT
ncbi:hypothetical protein RND71_038253 [Anisodus tanguticus]|uniref:4-coumarate--CoA ligase n=1 Tax=Anisodus tanguticus TaxID=243964 RepID=A0AAE1R2B2_9SOLA|nr:hypothetical protein RND71_038253 [Anisodus tanguticus]